MAYLAYYENMSTDELLEFMKETVPGAGLSQDSLAFLQAFAQRILNERTACTNAEEA